MAVVGCCGSCLWKLPLCVMEQDSIYEEAMVRFQELFNRVAEGPVREPAAVTLATADVHGRPSARVVLLRGLDARGFVFFTNSRSRKGRQIADNPQAALCFYWEFLGEQVRIEGCVKKVDDEESDNYWNLRPRESRIGAWASFQSERLSDRSELDLNIAKFNEKYIDQEVPRPPHWYGYRITPQRIEFWKEGANRLHTRTVYEADSAEWNKFSIYP